MTVQERENLSLGRPDPRHPAPDQPLALGQANDCFDLGGEEVPDEVVQPLSKMIHGRGVIHKDHILQEDNQ